MEDAYQSKPYSTDGDKYTDLSALVLIARIVNQEAPLESVLSELVTAVAGILNTEAAWITLLAPCNDQAQVHYTVGIQDFEERSYPIEGSPDEVILKSQNPISMQLYQNSEHPSLQGIHAQSLIGAAMRSGGQEYGTLKVLFDTPKTPEENELLMLESIAQLAAAVTRAHCLAVEVDHLSHTDALTGLHNLGYFLELANLELRRTQRYAHKFSLMMIDIDHFREVNETHGHSVGDQVLQGVSNIFTENLRAVDLIGRFGGEEFVVLLPETGLNDALGVAGRLLYTLRSTPIDTSVGEIRVTISIGISGLVDKDEITLDHLLDRADKALYQSKKNGRNRVTVWVED